MSISHTPTFNLKVVLKETGIAADTLRAWERRYGLPMPDRTPGGHRLYSQHDIEIIKWLMSKQEEGLSISRAVDLWNELTASGQDPLLASLSGTMPVTQTISIPGANLDAVRQAWLRACLDFDESAAEQVLNQAFAIYPLETACLEVLQRGLHEVGEMWYRAKATVQQEHFTSALAHRRLDALIAAAPPPTRQQTILIGCALGERHTFPSLLLALLLRRYGLKVIYLGANVPTQRFNETVYKIKPQLVILSAQLLQTANGLRKTAEQLQVSQTRVAYGGRIFGKVPELCQHIPAHFLGESVLTAVQPVETLLTSNDPPEGILPVSPGDIALSASFTHDQPMIDTYVLTKTIKVGIPSEYAMIAIQQLGKNLSSALSFGNIEAMGRELEWVTGLLVEYNQSPDTLGVFLEAYATSVDAAMGKKGQSISAWLRKQIKD